MPYLVAALFTVVLAAAMYFFFVMERGDAYAKALVFAERGMFTDARGLIRGRLDSDPDNFRAHFAMARIYAIEGNPGQELYHLEEIKRINRYSPEINAITILNRIGEIYYTNGDYNEAFEAYLDALSVNSKNEAALAYLAFLSIGQEQFDIAERYLRRLVELSPNRPEYHLARGIGLAMMKNGEAIRELEMALNISPGDPTAKFLTSFQAYRNGEIDKSLRLLEELLPTLTDPAIIYIANKLAVNVYYLKKDYRQAMTYAERCLETSTSEAWTAEEFDNRLSVAYMAMLNRDLEKANEHLLELEINNPTNQTVMTLSDFRMDLEEGITSVDQVSPRGFDFRAHLQDWLRKRFPEGTIYNLSGLRMDETFDVLSFFTQDGSVKDRPKKNERAADPMVLIDRFNGLEGNAFQSACEQLINSLGHRIVKILPYRDRDGADFITAEMANKKTKALVRIRKWRNQPISDIFLRDMQNLLNEQKVNLGFVVAGARLTDGAESALKNLKKITVINDADFAAMLQKIL